MGKLVVTTDKKMITMLKDHIHKQDLEYSLLKDKLFFMQKENVRLMNIIHNLENDNNMLRNKILEVLNKQDETN